jgi:DNA-binding CsgD family transcriptional regulator
MLSSGNKAEMAFTESLNHYEQTHREFERARVRLAYGSWLRRERRRKDARDQLRASLEVFDRLSALPWSERTESELRACGVTSHRRGELAFFDLTPQEFQVARLVGEGLTNRDAAAQLYLSTRTVDHHLRNVYVKLGITSRAELMRLHLAEIRAN